MNIIKFLVKHTNYKKKAIKKFLDQELVFVNGVMVDCRDYELSRGDLVVVDGQEVIYPNLIIIGLNKPKGYMCSQEDEAHPTVRNLLPDKYQHLFMVGRLDMNTTGLLLFTNDGILANDLTKPESDCLKSYIVSLNHPINDYQIYALENGVVIYDTYITKQSFVKKLDDYKIVLTISEGKFHQVKIMLRAVGNYVCGLERLSFGEYQLDETIKLGEIQVFKE